MASNVAYAGDFPGPCAFCPSGNRALMVVFGVQSLFVVLLVAIGVGLSSAVAVAVGLVVVDALLLGARLAGQRAGGHGVASVLVPLLRSLLGATPQGTTGSMGSTDWWGIR